MKMVNVGKKKLLVIGVAAVFAIGGVGYKVYADNQYKTSVSQAITMLQKTGTTYSSLDKDLKSFYENDEQEFFVKDITLDEFKEWQIELDEVKMPTFDVASKELTKTVANFKKEKASLKEDFDSMVDKFSKQETVNSFFQKEKAINGSSVKTDLAIVDGLKADQILSFAEDDKGSWVEALKKVLQNATDQLNQIKKASEQVNQFFKDKNVIDKIDEKALKTAQDEVKKIKNEKARKEQETRLNQVNEEVDKRKKAAAEKEAAATLAAAAQPTNGSTTNAANSDGVSNQGYSGDTTYTAGDTSGSYTGGTTTGGGYTGGGNPGGGTTGGGTTGGGNPGGGNPGGGTTGGGTTGGGTTGGGTTGGGNSGGGTVIKPNENGGEDIYDGW